MDKQVLLVSNLIEAGKEGVAAMSPILSYMGFPASKLPTALLSNSLDYEHFELMDTTEHMRRTLKAWDALDFCFDAVAVGFIASSEQADLVGDYCSRYEREDACILVDPIMADDGRLYRNLGGDTIASMRTLVSEASLSIPNYTEACLLTGTDHTTSPLARREADRLLDDLLALGPLSALVTSCLMEGVGHCVIGYDAFLDERFVLPYEHVDANFRGTGDVFAAVLLGRLLQGQMLASSTQCAMDAVREMIRQGAGTRDPRLGLPIEELLEVVDEVMC